MLTRNLYEEILLDPAKQGADNLYIVSGYASPSMVEMHMSSIRDISGEDIAIHLVIGMVGKDGIARSNHEKFCNIVRKHGNSLFQCHYITENHVPVHSKVYAWSKGKTGKFGFSGSANYTLTGFTRHREVMEVSSPNEALTYYESMVKYGCPCVHTDVDGLVKDDAHVENVEDDSPAMHHDVETSQDGPFTVSLLDKNGVPHGTSWLNWGQREGRNPNQAYIGLPTGETSITNDFFPARGVPFTVHTDDGLVFICSRCQDRGKAIHTPNNAHLGEYFRKRLALESGAPITLDALNNYGRTDIKFYKIDEGEYYMDFSSGNL